MDEGVWAGEGLGTHVEGLFIILSGFIPAENKANLHHPPPGNYGSVTRLLLLVESRTCPQDGYTLGGPPLHCCGMRAWYRSDSDDIFYGVLALKRTNADWKEGAWTDRRTTELIFTDEWMEGQRNGWTNVEDGLGMQMFFSVLHISINDHSRDSWGVKGCDDYSLCKPSRQNRVQVSRDRKCWVRLQIDDSRRRQAVDRLPL